MAPDWLLHNVDVRLDVAKGESKTCQAGSTVCPHTQTTVVIMIEKGISKARETSRVVDTH